MLRVRWHRLLGLFPRKTTLALDHVSKRFHRNKKPSSDNESFWSQMFGKYLFVTNTVGSGLLLGIGDALAQYSERLDAKNSFDYSRSRSMLITGLIVGPVQHGFYHWLDRIFVGNTRPIMLKKLLMDQLIMAPTYIGMFFIITSLLEGQSLEECHEHMSEKFLYTWALDFLLFSPLQYMNFSYLTGMYRVVVINLVNCLYVVLLSYIKHRPNKEAK